MPSGIVGQAGQGRIFLSPSVLGWRAADQALLIAHEARHVKDFADGVPYAKGSTCYAFEARGFDQQAMTFRSLFGDRYDPRDEIEVVSREAAIWAALSGGHVTAAYTRQTPYTNECE